MTNQISNNFFSTHAAAYGKSHRDSVCVFSPVPAPMHYHTDFYEFSFVTYGECINVYEDKRYVMRKNTLFFFKKNTVHAIEQETGKGLHYSVIFRSEYFEQFCQKHLFKIDDNIFSSNYHSTELEEQEANYILHLANQLHRVTLSESQRKSLEELFLFVALTYVLSPKKEVINNQNPGSLDFYITDLVRRIDNFEFLTYSIKQIYLLYPVAQSTIISEFKKKTGLTIVEYIGNRKMDYAAQMLLETNRSITQIANDLNISSLSHFTHKFTEYHGMNPRDYRKTHLILNL